MFSWLPPTISKNSESVFPTMRYVGACSSSLEFCAEISATTPGTSALAIEVAFATTYQFPRFCSNESALSNIWLISKTDETFQSEMSPLKTRVPWNIWGMVVTEETFQLLRSWLKARALRNIWDMSVTEETFQLERVPLKTWALRNILDM